MGDGRSGPVLRQMGVLFRSGTVAGMTDGQLVERFATRRGPEGEVAFAAIVARHGPMVLGVCRQLLGDSHDADDAFQAAFLTLARKAGSLRQPDRLGPWLYGVAVRKARKLKQQRERRRLHERRRAVGLDEEAPAEARAEHHEKSAALHEELTRLPEKYRAPIVLCYLQGHTHETAATALGWPLGTVRGRLARAREQLRERLTRRGVAPAGMILGEFPRSMLRATVPTRLADAMVHAASPISGRWAALLASLTGLTAVGPGAWSLGVSRVAVLLVLAGVVAAGGFTLGRQARVEKPGTVAVVEAPRTARERQAEGLRIQESISPDEIPGWVGDAVRDIQPEALIERALRESATAYVVDIRVRGEARLVRVVGRFHGHRKLVTVRRIPGRGPAGRRA